MINQSAGYILLCTLNSFHIILIPGAMKNVKQKRVTAAFGGAGTRGDATVLQKPVTKKLYQ